MKTIHEIPENHEETIGKRAIPLICAWCDKIIGIIKWESEKGITAAPTHGICPECFKRSMAEIASRAPGIVHA